jgi:hypothetical protein
MSRDAFEIAIDQILEGADGDVRLALRTVLIQNLQLESQLQVLTEQMKRDTGPRTDHSLN